MLLFLLKSPSLSPFAWELKPASSCPASGLALRWEALGPNPDVLTILRQRRRDGWREGQISLKERAFSNLDIQMDYSSHQEKSVGTGGGGEAEWDGQEDGSPCFRGLEKKPGEGKGASSFHLETAHR